MIWSTQR